MAKAYPLCVEVAHCDDDRSFYYSKGHHSIGPFAVGYKRYTGDDLEDTASLSLIWWRVVPDSTGKYDMRFHEATPGSRGAFPVTILEEQE